MRGHSTTVQCRSRGMAAISLAVILVGGCAPVSVRTYVNGIRSSQGGVRYYLPKPYLVITRDVATAQPKITKTTSTTKEDGKETKKDTTTTENVLPKQDGAPTYAMQIVYLPDLKTKAYIKLNPTLGSAEVSINLEDGWKLTSLNIKSDSKTAETIGAIGAVVGAAAPLFASAPGGGGALREEIVKAMIDNLGDLSGLSPAVKEGIVGWLREFVKPPEDESHVWVFEIKDDGQFTCVWHFESGVPQTSCNEKKDKESQKGQ